MVYLLSLYKEETHLIYYITNVYISSRYILILTIMSSYIISVCSLDSAPLVRNFDRKKYDYVYMYKLDHFFRGLINEPFEVLLIAMDAGV